MKKLSAIIIGVLSFIQLAGALTYQDVVGTWRGTRMEVGRGYSLREPTVVKIRQLGSGLVLRSIITVPGVGVIYGLSYLKPNGVVEGFAQFNGVTTQAINGRWYAGDNTLLQVVRSLSVAGTFTERSSMIISGRSMHFITTTSIGVTISGLFHK